MIEHFIRIEELINFSRRHKIKVLNIFQTEQHSYRQVASKFDDALIKSYVYTTNNYFLVFEYINEDEHVDEKIPKID